ncbi:ABC transporter permease [Leucobacter chironomi]|uniref:ABC transporter permease n=1 Tax=Leucobacter chironomi TaxID=491918 RepID=UPI0003F69C40|nr:ABC transporter permease [Leucobacter chironomi]
MRALRIGGSRRGTAFWRGAGFDAARSFGWSGWISAAILVVALIAVCAPQLLAPGDPLAVHPADGFQPPSAAHLFGTDESGRDLFTRVVHGAAASVGIGLAATGIGIGVGAVLGFAAGLGPRWLDGSLGRVFEVLFALPTLVMALLFISVMGSGPTASILAIGLATIPGYARMLRARVRGIAASGYAEWARLDEVGPVRVFVRHIAPNSLWPLASAATLGIGQAIVWVSALGFLGLGALPPSPEWGAMLNAGRVYLTTAWWMTVCPGLAIVLVAGALTVLGRRLGAARD